jgi:hypothetical protein
MKKQLITLLLLVLVFTSCEPNKIGDFDTSKVPDFVIDTKVNKKGVCFTNKSLDWSHKTSAAGAHWMYSWGTELRAEIPENVEFVPMFWGKGSVNDANINRIKDLVAQGKVKYILGFNEPDGAAQANMTVDEAIALWPRLEEIGVPIGSPATVSPNNAWMIDFMKKAEAKNLRVDFVAVHHYGGPNVMAMVNKLKETYVAYKRPIWITEFAVADWGAASPAANRYSKEQVIDFMTQGLKALDEIEWIHRYSWFSGTQAPLFTSALFDDNSVITEPGVVYANHTRNPTIGPGVDTSFVPVIDPDELLVNGNFETGMLAPWLGFKNGVSTNEPKTGGFCGQLQNHDASLYTIINVIPGKTYNIKYSTRWASIPSNTYSPALRIEGVSGTPGLLKTLDPVAMTDQWTDYTTEVLIPSGVTKMRFVFFKGQLNPQFPPAFIDDVSVKEKK